MNRQTNTNRTLFSQRNGKRQRTRVRKRTSIDMLERDPSEREMRRNRNARRGYDNWE